MNPEHYAKHVAALKRDADRDPNEYQRQRLQTLLASELFKRDHPNGNMPHPLPQYRSSYPDPLRIDYEQRALHAFDAPDPGPEL